MTRGRGIGAYLILKRNFFVANFITGSVKLTKLPEVAVFHASEQILAAIRDWTAGGNGP